MSDVSIEARTIETIPALIIRPATADRAPVVCFIPGMWRTKTDGLALGVRLAQHGIACVSIDPVDHGDRYDERVERIDHPVYPFDTGLDMFVQFLRVIQQSALDVGTLLRALASDPHLDTARAGVTGISMGSYASFLAFAGNPALQAAVPMMGIRLSPAAGSTCSTNAHSATPNGATPSTRQRAIPASIPLSSKASTRRRSCKTSRRARY